LNPQTLMMKLVEKAGYAIQVSEGNEVQVFVHVEVHICRPFPTDSLIPFSYLFSLNVFSPH
jgi:hypothetical protein